MPFDLSFDYLLGMTVWLAALVLGLAVLVVLKRRTRTDRRGLQRLFLAGLSLWIFLASLTAVELYFAVIYDQTDSFNMTNVSKHWFRRHIEREQRALKFRNSQGTIYRDDHDFPRELRDGQHHVCFVGDSFTFGHGVPDVADRFSNRIGADLERRFPGKFIVSNLADAGRDLYWVERVLEEVIRDKLPLQTVVYVICLNDIETFDDRTSELYDEIGSRAPQNFLFRDTYFLNLLYYRIQQARSARVGGYYSFLQDSYAGLPWEKMHTKLDEILELCRENGVDLRIAIFPFLHNLGPDYPFSEAHQRIVDYCAAREIKVLDLRPVLEPHVAEGLTVNRFDAHPNARAHELAGEAIESDLLGDLRPE
jgi:hypothetical protein